jgi:hypothetical protein
MKKLPIPLAALAVLGLSVQLAPAGDVKREGWHIAHVGGTVPITIEYPTVPGKMIQAVKVVVDDKVIEHPEMGHPDAPSPAKDGNGAITYIYHPTTRGKHRVDVLPVIKGSDGQTHTSPPKVFMFMVY